MNGRTKKEIYREALQLKIRENVNNEENIDPNHALKKYLYMMSN